MHFQKRHYLSAGVLVMALALAACGATGPTSEAPTTAATAEAPTTAATVSQPTQAATATPTAVAAAEPTTEPTVEPTAMPQPTAAPDPATTPTRAPSANQLPNDVPWYRIGKQISGDDESIDFEKYRLPIVEYRVQVSPDGAYIAYVSQDGMLAIVDTRNYDNHIRADEAIGQPVGMAFSPDSRSLAMLQIDQQNNFKLLVRDIASGDTRTIAEGNTFPREGGELVLVPAPIGWRANGLFVQNLLWASDAPPHGVTLIDPASGARQVITEDNHLGAYPSPDGSKVALVTGVLRIGEPPAAGISVLDITSGQTQIVIPEDQRVVRRLRWSPDGTKLLYADAGDYQSSTVWVRAINADGSNEQAIAVGSQAVQFTYADAAWLDNDTVLMLSADLDDFRLDRLPLQGFEPSNIQTIARGPRGSADPMTMEIIYTPGA
jgi:dipeptidyl aminopeptidase/acylaminoacyl peptidase